MAGGKSPNIPTEASWEGWTRTRFIREADVSDFWFLRCYENEHGLKENCILGATFWSTYPTCVGETASGALTCFHDGLCRETSSQEVNKLVSSLRKQQTSCHSITQHLVFNFILKT